MAAESSPGDLISIAVFRHLFDQPHGSILTGLFVPCLSFIRKDQLTTQQFYLSPAVRALSIDCYYSLDNAISKILLQMLIRFILIFLLPYYHCNEY
jgi:hypothetical protein